MGWLIALAVVCGITGLVLLLYYLPVGVRATYDAEGLKTWYTVLSLPIWPLDLLEDDEDDNSISLNKILTASGKAKQKEQPESIQKSKSVQGQLGSFWEEIKILLRFYWGLLDIVVLKRLELKLVMAGDDPFDLAIHYGEACAAAGGIVAALESLLTISKRNICVDCDFTAEQTLFTARLDFTVPLGRVVIYLFKFVFANLTETN